MLEVKRECVKLFWGARKLTQQKMERKCWAGPITTEVCGFVIITVLLQLGEETAVV